MASDNKDPIQPKHPSPESKSELSDEQLDQVQGGTQGSAQGGKPFLQFRFGTVFTTKIDDGLIND